MKSIVPELVIPNGRDSRVIVIPSLEQSPLVNGIVFLSVRLQSSLPVCF